MSMHRHYFTRFEDWCKAAKRKYEESGNDTDGGELGYRSWVEAAIPTLSAEDRSLLLIMVKRFHCSRVATLQERSGGLLGL
eukprot:1196193-Prorocentrum_minimum.AAC.4